MAQPLRRRWARVSGGQMLDGARRGRLASMLLQAALSGPFETATSRVQGAFPAHAACGIRQGAERRL